LPLITRVDHGVVIAIMGVVSESVSLTAELAELRAGLADAHELMRDLQRALVAKDEHVAALTAENAGLKARVAELERQLRAECILTS
jgi:tRNA pseudouridine-54 N-methylase